MYDDDLPTIPTSWCYIWLVFDGFTVVRVRFTAEGEPVEPGSLRACATLGSTWKEARERAQDWILKEAPFLGRLPHAEGGMTPTSGTPIVKET